MAKIFFIVFLLSNFSYSQFIGGEAKYGIRKTEAIFIQKNNSAQNELLKTVENEIDKNLPHFSFTLKYTSKEAIFEIDKILMDSGERGKRLAFITAQGYNRFYHNTVIDSTIMQTEVYGATFRVLTKISDMEWKISNEHKQIDGFLCYKATASYVTVNDVGTFDKKVIAWFAPQIPAPFGPAGFAGLPGLIVELQDDKLLYFLLKINPTIKDIKIEKFKKGKIVTKEQLDNFAFENANFRN